MKTTTAKSKLRVKSGVKLTSPRAGVSFQALPHPTDESRRDTGRNYHGEAFKVVCGMLLKNYDCFTLDTAYSLSRGIEGLDYQEVKSLFQKFTREALANGDIVSLPTIGDTPLYQVI